MRDFELPDLDPRLTWSVRITDADGSVLAEHTPEVVCLTASVGKLFLLVEVATQLCDGRLSPDQRIKIPADHWWPIPGCSTGCATNTCRLLTLPCSSVR